MDIDGQPYAIKPLGSDVEGYVSLSIHLTKKTSKNFQENLIGNLTQNNMAICCAIKMSVQ